MKEKRTREGKDGEERGKEKKVEKQGRDSQQQEENKERTPCKGGWGRERQAPLPGRVLRSAAPTGAPPPPPPPLAQSSPAIGRLAGDSLRGSAAPPTPAAVLHFTQPSLSCGGLTCPPPVLATQSSTIP